MVYLINGFSTKNSGIICCLLRWPSFLIRSISKLKSFRTSAKNIVTCRQILSQFSGRFRTVSFNRVSTATLVKWTAAIFFRTVNWPSLSKKRSMFSLIFFVWAGKCNWYLMILRLLTSFMIASRRDERSSAYIAVPGRASLLSVVRTYQHIWAYAICTDPKFCQTWGR